MNATIYPKGPEAGASRSLYAGLRTGLLQAIRHHRLACTTQPQAAIRHRAAILALRVQLVSLRKTYRRGLAAANWNHYVAQREAQAPRSSRGVSVNRPSFLASALSQG